MKELAVEEEADSAPGPKSSLAVVTGASGFIGGHLCGALLHRGFRVAALVRKSASGVAGQAQAVSTGQLSGYSLSEQPQLRVHTGDLARPDTLLQACRKAKYVFHLAGTAHVGSVDKAELRSTIVDGTVSLAQSAQQSGVGCFVYFSSALAAGSVAKAPLSPYAACKIAAEQHVLAMASEQFRVCVLRPVNVYGPGMKGNIAAMVRRIRSGTLPPLPRLSNPISLVAVQDLCELAILAAQSRSSCGRIYPVSDGHEYTPNELETAIYAALGKTRPAWYTPRVVFYLGALMAHLANSSGLWPNELGLRTYRNLTGSGRGERSGHMPQRPELTENNVNNANNENGGKNELKKLNPDSRGNAHQLGFKPLRTLHDELPAILASL